MKGGQLTAMLERTSGHSQRPDDTTDDVPENPTPKTIGDVLKHLRGDLTLRQVENAIGISNSYLSNLEMGRKNPGIKSLSKLATYYEVPLNGLLEYAGLPFDELATVHGRTLIHEQESLEEVKRSYEFVLTDPSLGHYEKPATTPSVDTQKFVVQIYEHYTGKKLL